MRKAVETGVSPEGFLLLDPSMNPIFVNHAAAEILLYPLKVGTQRILDKSLSSKIRDKLLSEKSSALPALVPKILSGRRLYHCRAIRVNGPAERACRSSVAVLLERGSAASISLAKVSVKFSLTTREQEVLQCLSEGGLTTKEIGARMGISPNTVKGFLRTIMLKMGVSTRSGILGKVIATKL
jgi:DNA-binding CsgD family transcriptional regulator